MWCWMIREDWKAAYRVNITSCCLETFNDAIRFWKYSPDLCIWDLSDTCIQRPKICHEINVIRSAAAFKLFKTPPHTLIINIVHNCISISSGCKIRCSFPAVFYEDVPGWHFFSIFKLDTKSDVPWKKKETPRHRDTEKLMYQDSYQSAKQRNCQEKCCLLDVFFCSMIEQQFCSQALPRPGF